jgi:hypothetical protein
LRFLIVMTSVLAILVSSCEITTTDVKRGYHPEEFRGVRSVYAQNHDVGKSYSIYKADEHEIPVWCSVKDTYGEILKSFNNGFITSEARAVPTFFVCYSGDRPDVSVQEIEASNGSVYNGQSYKTPFLQEEFSPYFKLYLIGIVLSGRGPDLIPEFFSLYREFCTDERIGCCMVNNGENIVFNIVLEDADDLSKISKTVEDVKTFLENRKVSRQDVMAGFNIFQSTLIDRCSYERWYYNSIYMGVVAPERFLDNANWLDHFKRYGSQKIKGVGVRIIDSKRLSSQEFGSLRDQLNRLAGEF